METSNRLQQQQQNLNNKKKKWFLPLIFSLIISAFLLLLSTFISLKSTSQLYYSHTPQTQVTPPNFVESKLTVSPSSSNTVPRIAYLISGSKGDGNRLKRTLKALYHPRNYYAVHLDLEASEQERLEFAKFVRNESLFVKLGNVKMVVKANLVTYRGPTMVANTLHGASILLKEASDWDWFINLSASDYPLVAQDGMVLLLCYVCSLGIFVSVVSCFRDKVDYIFFLITIAYT